jgi:trans-aconitate methyltransferase
VCIGLAGRLGLRMLTPRPAAPPRLALRFERLDRDARWDAGVGEDKYGADSAYARIAKLEDAAFLIDLDEALDRVAPAPDARVLELGCNRGDVLAHLATRAPGARLTGVDRSSSALALARARLPGARLVEADLAQLDALDLGSFDLVLTIGTLQSPGVDDRAVLRHVVQRLLAPKGAVILGVPNCRYVDGEVEHGARIVNLREPELGLVIADIAFYRRYLHQHWRRVFVTGSDTLFVTAVAIERP